MILATDILIKTALEAGLNDMRKNPWILEDVFSGLVNDQLSKKEFGWKDVRNATEWFIKETNIPVYLPYRIDTPNLPCIIVIPGQSSEMQERANLSDEGMIEDTDPKSATYAVQYVVAPFTPKAYDKSNGQITLPDNITNEPIAEGMFLVSKAGKAYQIKKLIGTDTITIAPNTNENFTEAYILPPTKVWNLHRELAFMQEGFTVRLLAQSNLVHTIYLKQLVTYILFRYREAYLEARGFEVSSLSVGPVYRDETFGKDVVYACDINLNGQVQADWIKFVSPKLSKVTGGIKILEGPRTPEGYKKEVYNQAWRQEQDDDFDTLAGSLQDEGLPEEE